MHRHCIGALNVIFHHNENECHSIHVRERVQKTIIPVRVFPLKLFDLVPSEVISAVKIKRKLPARPPRVLAVFVCSSYSINVRKTGNFPADVF